MERCVTPIGKILWRLAVSHAARAASWEVERQFALYYTSLQSTFRWLPINGNDVNKKSGEINFNVSKWGKKDTKMCRCRRPLSSLSCQLLSRHWNKLPV
jgi:hypothetical protein